MDPFQPLVQTTDLKTTVLQRLVATGQMKQDLSYDAAFDALMLLFAPNDRELVVHYLDRHIALLYRAEDYEIVGLQVEAFEHSLLPSHAALNHAWSLNDSTTVQNVGDMLVKVEERRPAVIREVLRSAESVLPETVRAIFSAYY